MTEAIIEFFRKVLNNDILTIIIIAVIPIIELRGAIPVAVSMGMGFGQSYFWALLGSSLVVPILLLLLKPILEWMKKLKIFRRLAYSVESMFKEKADIVARRAQGKGEKGKIDRVLLFKLIGVFAFVAIPLPLTGVWTGSAVAVFLGVPFLPALFAVVLGNATAGGIVTLLTMFFQPHIDAILTGFFIIVLLVLVFYIIKISLKMKKHKASDIEQESAKKAEETNLEIKDTAKAEDDKDLQQNSDKKQDPTIDLQKIKQQPQQVIDEASEGDADSQSKTITAVPIIKKPKSK